MDHDSRPGTEIPLTAIDIVETSLGDELGPDLIARVPSLPDAKLHDLAERYFAFVEGPHAVPPKHPDDLRPYISYHGMKTARRKYSVGISPADYCEGDQGVTTPALAEDGIKQHLLYCHSVVLDDPFVYPLDLYRYGVGGGLAADGKARVRRWVQNYLAFLSYVAPLVREGIVSFYPQVTQFWTDEMRARLSESIDLTDYLRAMGLEDEEPPSFVRWHYAQDAVESVAATIEAATRHPSRLDVYLPDRSYRQALELVVSDVRRGLGIPEHELRLLRDVLAIDVPRLDALTPADVVRLRQDEEAFHIWRKAVRSALAAADTVGDDVLDPRGEIARAIREEMRSAEAEVRRTVDGSAVLTEGKKGIVSLALGAIFGGALNPGQLAVDALEGGLGMAANVLIGASDDGTPRDPLLRHYALFEPSAA